MVPKHPYLWHRTTTTRGESRSGATSNETETLGDVIDRMADDTYRTSAELKEAVVNALTGAEAGPEEYNDERELLRIARDVSAAESRD